MNTDSCNSYPLKYANGIQEIPTDLRNFLSELCPQKGIWLNNQGETGENNDSFVLYDPATEEVITLVANGNSTTATRAVDAAEAAFASWSKTPPRFRGEILYRAFTIMHEKAEILAGLIAWENGKSLSDARAEVNYAAEFFRWYSEEAVRGESDFLTAPAGGSRTIITTRPVGICALVTPWNFPAAMATRKIAPALAAGCCVVLKPASTTPLTALAIMHILQEAGLPAGVVNMVPSKDSELISQTWIADSRVRLLSFTGSTPVGRKLLAQSAKRVLKPAMELGGNASFIIGPGANIDKAVAGALVAKFRNGGQACTAANRFYVHSSQAEGFLQAFAKQVEALKVAPAFAPEGSDVGPVISRKAQKYLHELLENALKDGAKILAQAQVPQSPGLFVAPTLLQVDKIDAEIFQKEIFGPLCPVYVYEDETEMLQAANSSEYGLATYVFGELSWALHLAEDLEAGMIGINRGLVSDPAFPFGGVKQSGLGREGGREGMKEYQEIQYFSIDW